jgi:uncharacterized RDD family membrane protein YckC
MTDVVTGEAVVLDVPVARFPSRMAALLIDAIVIYVIQLALIIVALLVFGTRDVDLDTGLLVTAFVLTVVGYPVLWETLSRGRSLGKLALGLRVVSDDGGPERFRQALVRGLAGAIEIWTVVFAPIGLITSIVSARGKRLGDMFAGTYVIQERMPGRPSLNYMFAVVPPPLLGWAQVAQVSGLSDQLAEAAGSYLRRYYQLNEKARADLGLQLAESVLARVSPAPPLGTPPAAFLAAVLALRRQHEQARLAVRQRLVAEAGREPAGWLTAGPGGAAASQAAGSGWSLPGAGYDSGAGTPGGTADPFAPALTADPFAAFAVPRAPATGAAVAAEGAPAATLAAGGPEPGSSGYGFTAPA